MVLEFSRFDPEIFTQNEKFEEEREKNIYFLVKKDYESYY